MKIKKTASELSERRLEQLYEYSKVIQWGRKNPIKFCEHFYGMEFLDNQKYVFMNSWTKPFNIWCQSRNSGKAIDILEPVATPFGWRKLKDVKVGDIILDNNMKRVRVKYVSPIYKNHTCYELKFLEDRETNRYSTIIADTDHLWTVSKNRQNKLRTMTTYELYKEVKKKHDYTGSDGTWLLGGKKLEKAYYYVPLALPFATKEKKHKLIVDINRVPSRPVRCIQVDNDTGLYCIGKYFTVTHNTTVIAPFVMAHTNLYPNFSVYIMSKVGKQSQESFAKIEKIARREIDSMLDLTDIFLGEIDSTKSDSDGFVHNPSSWYYKTLCASTVNSLNSVIDNLRGKRSNLNVYDEAGFIAEDMFDATFPFVAQDSDFALGKEIFNILSAPKIPNKILMASSSSDMSSKFYQLYREYGKKMLMGDPRYFVADIDAEIVKNATYNGMLLKKPLLTQEVIDSAMRTNKEKALREYYNKFSSDGGDEQPYKRSVVNKNTFNFIPEVKNIDNKSQYVLVYDPARQIDNSIIMGAKLYEDEKNGYMMDIVYGHNLIDIHSKDKRQLRYPEQEDFLRKKIVDFNGKQNPEYINIHCIAIDSGAGGSGRHIGDNLIEDWTDNKGTIHRGIIDEVEQEEYISRFPNADNKLRLLSPKKLKSLMFESLETMLDYGLIRFPEDYDGYLDKIEIIKDIELSKPYSYVNEDGETITTKIKQEIESYDLSNEEKIALANITLAKEELYAIRKSGVKGSYKYELSPELANSMHDDRAYCMAMLGYILNTVRNGNKGIENEIVDKNDWLSVFRVQKPNVYGQ